MPAPAPGPTVLDERFTSRPEDRGWTLAYLPAWSSRSAAAAAARTSAEGLHLTIPPDHPVWCPGDHEPPLRVSAAQSGSWSGPVGSTRGQQPFRPGQTVREEQPARWACTPRSGRVEVTCRATVGPGSMFSAWLVGVEDVPERSGELCLVEVFGDTLAPGPGGAPTAALGSGVHPFRDPGLREEFSAPRTTVDVAGWHTYAVEWRPGRAVFELDGVVTRELAQAPDYPLQLMLGVFDFPGRPHGAGSPAVPELVVRRVRVTPG
ncbi:glycoside hydrolase family 16 protein [Cellulomonas sp. ACRRI]|uniref:glycoside hydrolase family 16 protein n=1 Tax=Cellulomonas sp. ACRRI TaxID=2918188 RepID=UPI001EF1A595|nr:glycoside hydrolase family 16 protein [Cellulomonas sp. ACRRI]MCG7287490.1 glycoside hydrolase family 16 protein [Cellulomonas sp. ACRRI]